MLAVLGWCMAAAGLAAAETPRAVPRIIDGTPVDAFAFFPTVGYLTNPASTEPFSHWCTVTLISPNHVLLAAHCVTDAGGVPQVTTAWKVYLPSGPNGVFSEYSIQGFWVHDNWHGTSGIAPGTDGNIDAAIILINQSTMTTPSRIYRKAPHLGDSIHLVGYGDQRGGANPHPKVNHGYNTIDFEPTADYFKWRFDLGESTTDHGDSGGPAFIQSKGIDYLGGITSGGNGLATTVGIESSDTRVDSIASWIDPICGFTNLVAGPSTAGPTAPLRAGQSFPVTAITSNEGYQNAAPFKVTFRLSTDPLYDHSDLHLGDFSFTNGLGARTDWPASWTGPCPNLSPGQYYVVWEVDPDAHVRQSDIYDDTSEYFGYYIPVTIRANATPVLTSSLYASPNPTITGTQVQFAVSASDSDNDTLTYAWNFGDGVTGTGSSVQHAYSATGTYSASISVTDGYGGTVTGSVSITVNDFLTVDAPTPNPAIVGQAVKFSATALDPSGGYVSYVWTLADGTVLGYLSTLEKIFGNPGTYTVRVQATGASKSGAGVVSVTVLPGFRGHPSGQKLSVNGYGGKFVINFVRSYSDSLTFQLWSSDTQWGDKWSFANEVSGQDMKVIIGDTQIEEVTLSGTGKGYGSAGTRFTWKYSNGVIKYILKRANLADILSEFGAVDDGSFHTIKIPISVEIGGVTLTHEFTFFYNSRLGKIGKGG